MKTEKIYFVCPKFLYNNEIFNLSSHHNWDNAFYPYFLLKQSFLEKGIDLITYDCFKKSSENYALLFHDIRRDTSNIIKKHKKAKKFLIEYESPIKNRDNQDINNHKRFEKIFTWNTKLVDNLKYFRLSYAREIPKTLDIAIAKEKLLTAVYSYKLQTHNLELYSERIKAIRWFEKNHPQNFDLYGIGWNDHYFKDKLFHLNRIKILKKIIKPNFPSYRGQINNKKDIYNKYKFGICYENAVFPDYLTEKIFDCFLGGCVPIYLGAPNINDFIPEGTFIDKRKFNSYEDLYCFINNMSNQEYKGYLERIKSFIESDKIYPFSAECFAKTLCEEISKSL